MTDTDNHDEMPEPARIRALRRLVTALTLTLILGMIVIIGLMVWRLGPGAPASAPAPALPAAVVLPESERLTGYAQNPAWTVLITTDETGTQRLHLVPAGSTAIHQSVTIEPVPDTD